jgi:NADPH:quinone reductase-like Zn-dependent oxidoreductase
MRAIQIIRFGGPEVLETVDVAEPTPDPGQQLYDLSTAGHPPRRHPPPPVVRAG